MKKTIKNKSNMKKSTIGLIAVIVIIGFWLMNVYNGMVGLDEGS